MKNKWIKRLATVCFLVSFGTLTYIAGFDRINGGALQSLFGQGTDDAHEGVPEDFTEEAKRITKAAEQGYADAQYLLGMLYKQGIGMPEDPREAARWDAKAAE